SIRETASWPMPTHGRRRGMLIDSPRSLGNHSGVTVGKSPDEHPPLDDTALLTAALGHSWAWYDERTKRAFLVVNYYLLAVAVLATASTSAIEKNRYGLAAGLAVGALGLTLVASIAGLQEIRAAKLALPAIAELHERIVERLNIDEFSMVTGRPWVGPPIGTYILVMVLATVNNTAGLLYAVMH